MLPGGAVGYKANLIPTVAISSTEAEFMEAAIVGQMVLYCRSVMLDLGVPQCATTIGYKEMMRAHRWTWHRSRLHAQGAST